MLTSHCGKSIARLLALLSFIAAASFFVYKTTTILQADDRNDLKIFIAYGQNYIETGQLYAKSEDLTIWQPSGGIYKFPPAYQLMIVPFLKAGVTPDTLLKITAFALISIYLLSIFVLISVCTSSANPLSSTSVLILGASLLIFTPFYSAFSELAAEILIFGLLVAMLFTLSKKQPVCFGILLAIAVHIKVYPVLIVFYLLATRAWRSIVAFAVMAVVMLLTCISYFGLTENLYYFTTVLPVLGSEAPYPHFQNLSLEIWLENNQWIDHPDGNIQNALRLLMLAIATGISAMTLVKSIMYRELAFGIFCSGLLIWLTNYWPQYQLMLLIPFVLFWRHAMLRNSWWIYAVVFVAGLTLLTTRTGLFELVSYQVDIGMIDEAAMSLYSNSHSVPEVLFEFSLAGWCYYWLLQMNVFLPHILLLAGIMALYQDWYFQYHRQPEGPSR